MLLNRAVNSSRQSLLSSQQALGCDDPLRCVRCRGNQQCCVRLRQSFRRGQWMTILLAIAHCSGVAGAAHATSFSSTFGKGGIGSTTRQLGRVGCASADRGDDGRSLVPHPRERMRAEVSNSGVLRTSPNCDGARLPVARIGPRSQRNLNLAACLPNACRVAHATCNWQSASTCVGMIGLSTLGLR